ncbi:transposase [Bifidobacterium breve]|uniref:transposase n=1 Tax=Bifidobacterium breve TaxID=1685 RepID=UPI0039C8B7AD
MDRRRFDILRTIRSGLSNARLEAVNNKIKTTIKMGYGYRNLGNLIAWSCSNAAASTSNSPDANNP